MAVDAQYKDMKKDELVAEVKRRAVAAGATEAEAAQTQDHTKAELVELLQAADAASPHVAPPEKVEEASLPDTVAVEYTGMPSPPPLELLAYMDDPRQLKPGDSFEVSPEVAKRLLANADFRPAGEGAEKVAAMVAHESERGVLLARANLASPVDGVSGEDEVRAQAERIMPAGAEEESTGSDQNGGQTNG